MTRTAYRIADDNVLTVSGRSVCVVVNDDTGERMAFYRSSGRNGGAAAGAWCPVHGFRYAPGYGGVWFVKHSDARKLANDGTEWHRMAAWLTANPPTVGDVVIDFPRWSRTDGRVIMSILREIDTANRYLTFLGVPDRADAPRTPSREIASIRVRVRRSFRA